ncbi:peptidylprolyl isomerase [Belnapia sp. T6]|uniref:Parvulin-like PPIase n=1 Tax=Belnapia mucosa TaxID=2804532 RepID=A0ABS1UZV0_9PROT|nr:peptidylprolyl isomerase [Belnapia mucosa]MBL6454983.1 peptidylprolyl isomerase [Belnapia mucosa]
MPFRPVLLAALLFPLGALAQPAGTPPAATSSAAGAQQAEDPVLARVNGEPVRLSDVMATAQDVLPAQMRGMPGPMLMQMLPPELAKQLVDRTITERALTAAARAAGLDRDEEVRRRMQRAEDQELQQAYLSREVNAIVTDAALRARYDQDAGRRQGEEEVHARHILVQTEAEAKAVLAELAGGADFADLAKRRSRDPGAHDGGDLGFFKRADMVPEFAEAAFALQPGQVSPAPVRSPFGWHVIKLEERRAAPVKSFEESRSELRQKMLEEQVPAVVERARASVKVERLDQPAPSLLDTAAPPAATPPAAAPPAAAGRPAPQPQRR